MPQFEGVNLVGVSPDDVRTHARFADKYGFSFTLLSDPDRRLIEPLGLWVEKSLYGKTYFGVARTTFLIDEDGTVLRIFRNVKPQGHAEEVRSALD